MYNYLNILSGSGVRNVRYGASQGSSVMRTVSSPCTLKLASTSDNRDDLLIQVTNQMGDGAWEYWLQLADGGYIRYLYADENGGFHDQLGTIVQSDTPLDTSGVTTTSTSSQQVASNTTDDTLNQTMEDMEEGNDLSAGEYYVSLEDIQATENDSWTAPTDGSEFYNIRSVIGILGLPYQFMPHVDLRMDGTFNNTSTGSEYASKIVSSMPLLMITPGIPAFMKGYSDEEKQSTIESLLGTVTGSNADSLNELLSRTGRYYTFKPTVPDFFNYLNPMARICARLMEVQDKTMDDGTTLDNVDWMVYTQQKVENLIDLATDYMAIPIYLDSETQISESFSNDTTESSLASTINGFSDMARELMFVLGYGASALDLDSIVSADNLLENNENLNDLVNKLQGMAGGSGFFNSLIKQAGSVATGGRLIFPKIWSDSSFSRSYNVTVKLRSPDMDNFSLFLNIILPICFFLCLTQPRMMTNNPNAYASPFLVRAMYKGFFNVDMGIITSLDFTKGDEAQWNNMGIPTSVDVNMTITDLYEAMSITATSATGNYAYDTLDNTALMDYLMTMCGINVYKPEISRAFDLWFVNNFENRARDLFSVSLWGNIRQSISNAIVSIYRRKA